VVAATQTIPRGALKIMKTAEQKSKDSRYWIRQAYSKSLLDKLIGKDEPDINGLARICNFLGWIDHKILTNLGSSKVIKATTYRNQFLDSNKLFKDFRYNIYIQKPIQNVLTATETLENVIGGRHNIGIDRPYTILCDNSVINPPDPFKIAGYRDTYMVTMDSQDTLRKLLGGGYSAHIKQLLELGIIVVDDSYCVGSEESEGVCKSYGITSRGKRLLDDAQKEYLYKLTSDAELIRKTKRNIKDRGYFNIKYADEVLQNTKENIDNIENIDELIELIPTIKAHRGKSDAEAQRVARYCLIKLLTKKYKPLSINEKTGRIYPPTATLSKPLKKAAIVNGRKFVYSIDIRSCIPTFFGLYCLRIRKHNYKAQELEVDDDQLAHEVDAYTAIFCSAGEHPRKYLAKALKADLGHSATDKEIKAMLNEGLNGSGREECKIFRQWIKKRYPLMYKVWMTTDIRTSGSNLSLYYEKPIFRDARVIKYAKKCDLEYVDNHDEALLFGESDNANKFIKWFIPFARKQVGIEVQFTVEFNTEQKEK
jgi:hypothetical protein